MITRLAGQGPSQQGLCPTGQKGGSRAGPGSAARVSPQSRSPDKLVGMRHRQVRSDEARRLSHRSGTGLLMVTRVRYCPVINRQDHRDETGLRSSWKVVHGSGSGSMRSMARHRHGCDRAVNRYTYNQSSSDRF